MPHLADWLRIDTSTSLDSEQMAFLQQAYTQPYDRDLEKDIRGYVPSYFKDTILGMIKGPAWSDVEGLGDLILEPRKEMRNFVFSEIIFYRTQAKLQEIKELYHQNHSRPLAEWVKLRCSADTAQLLVKYLETGRCEDGTDALDTQSIRVDAQLVRQGIRQKGTDIDYVLDILARSSRERLIALMDEFDAMYHVSLVDYIEVKTTGALRCALSLLLSWAEDPIQYSRQTSSGGSKRHHAYYGLGSLEPNTVRGWKDKDFAILRPI